MLCEVKLSYVRKRKIASTLKQRKQTIGKVQICLNPTKTIYYGLYSPSIFVVIVMGTSESLR